MSIRSESVSRIHLKRVALRRWNSHYRRFAGLSIALLKAQRKIVFLAGVGVSTIAAPSRFSGCRAAPESGIFFMSLPYKSHYVEHLVRAKQWIGGRKER
jgi:hypothetical protein